MAVVFDWLYVACYAGLALYGIWLFGDFITDRLSERVRHD